MALLLACLALSTGPTGAQTSETIPLAPPLPVSPTAPPLPVIGEGDAPPAPAPSAAPTTKAPTPVAVVVSGRGFGHGRGLGQWGAYGYAVERGWTYRQILDHFYGGTVAGAVSPLSAIGVRLSALDGKPLIVFQPKGRLFTAVDGQAGFTLPPGFEGAQSVIVTGDPLNPGGPVPVGAAAAANPIPAQAPSVSDTSRTDPPLLTGAASAVKV